jgi:hypothetical protein
MRYHRPNVVTKSALRASYVLRIAVSGRTYIIKDVEISSHGVASCHNRAIVWDLDGVVKLVEIDSVEGSHLERVPTGSKIVVLLMQEESNRENSEV